MEILYNSNRPNALLQSLLSVTILVIVGLAGIHEIGCTEFMPLSCYRCISLECTTSPEICALAKAHMQTEVEKYYYMDGYSLPDCPAPKDEVGWEELKAKTPSRLACGEFASGQATCVLGRFQVNSLVIESNTNLTSYGTVLGCANKRLLDSTKAATLGKDRRSGGGIDIATMLVGCHSDYYDSPVRDSLKHYSRLEHCVDISEMCYTSNYCIHPRFTEVRPFRTNRYNQLNEPGQVPLFTIFIWAAVVIGVIVAIMTFAGIKYS